MTVKAIFPGTFDPITNGHVSLIKKAQAVFDEVLVAVVKETAKTCLFSSQERLSLVKMALSDYSKVKPVLFEGLLVDFAHENQATVILRGIRTSLDFEYEKQMAQMNNELANTLETFFLFPEPHLSFISSSLVKEVACLGKNVQKFVPECVNGMLLDKYI